MAVAGLQSVSVLDSSFHRESQSPLSRQWGNHDRPSTRASSLLQMWREIEGEHVVSHSQVRVGDRQQERIDVSNADILNPYLSEKQDSDSGHEDGNSSSSEQSTDSGEAERGRVRQILQEWMNSGVRGDASVVYPVDSYSRERMASQQRGICAASKEEQTPEIGAQIERGRDEFVNHCEIGVRKNLRKLCGRQALLDMLAKAEREKQTELQNLLECRPVSEFAYRNRIQTLLRGRFLQSGRLVQGERPSSMPPSELGLLRQQHTVSGVREGFLARLDNHHCPSTHAESDTSSSKDMNDFMNEQTQAKSSREDLVAIQEQSQPNNGEGDINQLPLVPFEGNAGQNINCPETNIPEEQQVGFSGNEDSRHLQSSNFTSFGSRDGLGENMGENSVISTGNAWSHETSGNEIEGQYFHLRPSGEERDTDTSANHMYDHSINETEDMHGPNNSVRVEQWPESVTDNEDNDSRQLDNIDISGWRDDDAEATEGNWSEGTAANHGYRDMLGTEGEEIDHMQDLNEQWHESGSQEAMEDFLEGPSSRQAIPVGRLENRSYFPDDDNVYSSEIRELLSRRSVSNLLRSDFRQSLDQVLQLYAERQAHASVDWEMDEISPSLREVEQDVQQSGSQNLGLPVVFEAAQILPPSVPVAHSQPFWDLDHLQDDNWLRNNLQQRLGMEWEIINDLRIDMARLQQRMDNMQRMLEACMDMQIELQRSVRQEVSAALNRSAGSTDCEKNPQKDESKWDHLRKGLCCICCDNSIDSLLYRCGHMCTCSKCADTLVQGSGKCPMCRAPVVEMIRAYSIQ